MKDHWSLIELRRKIWRHDLSSQLYTNHTVCLTGMIKHVFVRGHIGIPGIGLELACNWGLCGEPPLQASSSPIPRIRIWSIVVAVFLVCFKCLTAWFITSLYMSRNFKASKKIILSEMTLVHVPSFHPGVSDRQHTVTRGTCTAHLVTAAPTPGKA